MCDQLTPGEAALRSRPVATLSDNELERWMWACLRLSKLAPGLGVQRWLWRRRWARAMRQVVARTCTRMGAAPMQCGRCGAARPTIHVAYGHGAAERFAHFCAACSRSEPPGHTVFSEFDLRGQSAAQSG